MNKSLITLEHLTIGYDGRPVLSDISLMIAQGSFTGLLGTNGSGKSTLIKTILGIIPPLSGRLALAPVNGREPALGYVPQREALDPVFLLSCFEVVLMGACARLKPGQRATLAERDWTQQCLQETGTGALGRRQFSELSGGQRQRVLIARALATRPDFLLLDEPTAGVDAAATEAIMEVIGQLHERQRLTILMVSHDLPTVRRTTQQVIWLHQGTILHGPTSQLLSREKIEQIMDLELH